MYRPTVRYDDVYKEYVDNIFYTTCLDRNQIHRLALFTLAHSDFGKEILTKYLKKGMQLPVSEWKDNDHGVWLNQKWDKEDKVKTNADAPIKLKNQGVIKIMF